MKSKGLIVCKLMILMIVIILCPSYTQASTYSYYNDQPNQDEFVNKSRILSDLLKSIITTNFAPSSADNHIDRIKHIKLTALELTDPAIFKNFNNRKRAGVKRLLRKLSDTYIEVVNLNGSGITLQSLFRKDVSSCFIKALKEDIENLININSRKIYIYFDGEPLPDINISHATHNSDN